MLEGLQPYNLSGNQLIASAELRQHRSSEAKGNEDISQLETPRRKRRKLLKNNSILNIVSKPAYTVYLLRKIK